MNNTPINPNINPVTPLGCARSVMRFDLELWNTYSDTEFLNGICYKLNELIDVVNLTQAQFKQIVEWVDTMLKTYTQEQLQEWLDDGTFTKLINETLFKELNQKIDERVIINPIQNTIMNETGNIQNKQEQMYTEFGKYINFGTLNNAPVVKSKPYKGIDVIAHFYNDFGLQYTADGVDQSHGAWSWYDWRWNFTTNPNYDPSREAILGYYQGDNANVLDWILYWLSQSGVTSISLVETSGFDMTNWNNPSSKNYWIYQLLNVCKNGSAFKYVPWLYSKNNGHTPTTPYLTSKSNLLDFIAKYPNMVNTYQINNKNYVCIFVWDMEGIRGSFDNYQGNSQTNAFFIQFAKDIQNLNLGFDGIYVMGRMLNQNFYTVSVIKSLEQNGVIMRFGYYVSIPNGITNYEEYSNYIASYSEIEKYKTANAFTALVSSPAHPSTYDIEGSTPYLFSKVLNNRISEIERFDKDKIITLYNVSEWAEGGAGLIPNMETGYGYLNALSSVLPSTNHINTEQLINTAVANANIQNKDNYYGNYTVTVNTGRGVIELTDLKGVYTYLDNAINYCMMVQIVTTTSNPSELDGITLKMSPSWNQARTYVAYTNSNSTALENVNINVFIKKIVKDS